MKYKKKPVVIEAVQYNGFVDEPILKEWFYSSDRELFLDGDELFVKTLEGKMKVSLGDFIIKGIKGELYPCKPDIFKETYEKV